MLEQGNREELEMVAAKAKAAAARAVAAEAKLASIEARVKAAESFAEQRGKLGKARHSRTHTREGRRARESGPPVDTGGGLRS